MRRRRARVLAHPVRRSTLAESALKTVFIWKRVRPGCLPRIFAAMPLYARPHGRRGFGQEVRPSGAKAANREGLLPGGVLLPGRVAPDLRKFRRAGERNVTIGTADKIARALDTTLASMFSELEQGRDASDDG